MGTTQEVLVLYVQVTLGTPDQMDVGIMDGGVYYLSAQDTLKLRGVYD